jgi:hypothetical protein
MLRLTKLSKTKEVTLAIGENCLTCGGLTTKVDVRPMEKTKEVKIICKDLGFSYPCTYFYCVHCRQLYIQAVWYIMLENRIIQKGNDARYIRRHKEKPK